MSWLDAFKDAWSAGDVHRAESVCRAAVSADREDWNALYLLGMTLRRRGDFHGALAAYNAALKNCPRPAPVLTACGIAHQQLGNFSEAISAFGRSLELEPESEECLNSLALTQKRAGHPYKAIYNYCLALDVCARRAWETVRARGGATREVNEQGQTVLVLHPGFEDLFADAVRGGAYFTILRNIGAALTEIGDIDRGAYFLDRARSEVPVDDECISQLMTEVEQADRRTPN